MFKLKTRPWTSKVAILNPKTRPWTSKVAILNPKTRPWTSKVAILNPKTQPWTSEVPWAKLRKGLRIAAGPLPETAFCGTACSGR